MKISIVSALCIFTAARAFAAADTLVEASGSTYKAGLAKSWTIGDNQVTFILSDGADSTRVAQVLRERLAQVTVTVNGNQIKIAGIPAAALLDQVSALHLNGEADPLAALAGLGPGASEKSAPEGGGSIRASKPTPLPSAFSNAVTPDVNERFEVEVSDVVRAAFPSVGLKLKVRKDAKAGPLKGKLAMGKTIEVKVAFAEAAKIDLSNNANQKNLAAYYLLKGDRVNVNLSEKDGVFTLEWLERTR